MTKAIGYKKLFVKDVADKRQLPKIHKELLKFNNKKTIHQMKWAKDLNRHLTKEDMQMTTEHMKTCSASCH